jgi:hypothetical protein
VNEPAASVDRPTAERVIARALELASRDASQRLSGLTPDQLVAIGRELGVEERHVRVALAEVLAGSVFDPGLLGTGAPVATRVVPGEPEVVSLRLAAWLERIDAMRPLRAPGPEIAVYEPKKGLVAAARVRLGQDPDLRECQTLTVSVRPTGEGTSVVRLEARLSRDQVIVGLAIGVGGTIAAAIGGAVFAWPLLIVVPFALALGAGCLVAQRRDARRVAVALERRLDRVARGETPPDTATSVAGALGRLKSLTSKSRPNPR